EVIRIKAAGYPPEASRVRLARTADLDPITARKSLISHRVVLGPEADTAVATVGDASPHAQVKVLEIIPLGIEMAELRSGTDENSVLDVPVPRLCGDRHPAAPILAVEQGDEPGGLRVRSR